MELTDRYLQSLKQLLPSEQREDIIRELSENLHSEIEDKERELGRPLSEGEIRSLLQQHGTPMAAAERYVQGNRSFSFGRQIVGPVLFPFYLRVLAFTAGIQVIVVLALTIVGDVPNFFTTLVFHAFLQFAIVTGIFALIQANANKIPDFNPVSAKPKVPPTPRASRFESIVEIVAFLVILSWLKSVSPNTRFELPSGTDLYMVGSSWRLFDFAVFGIGLIRIGLSTANLFCPKWVRFPAIVRISCGLLWLVIIGYSLKAGEWIISAGARSGPSTSSLAMLEFANQLFFTAVVSATAIITALTVIELIRLLRGYYNPRRAVAAAG